MFEVGDKVGIKKTCKDYGPVLSYEKTTKGVVQEVYPNGIVIVKFPINGNYYFLKKYLERTETKLPEEWL